MAELKSDGPKLNFEVDFYGRGSFPPLALHSEGHQDTMGLCLYLTLAEYLTGDIIHLVVLDDVVMSVDASHRRHICTLLSKKFPDKQFLITTHDKTWAYQLQKEGVSKISYEFSRWSLDTGPFVSEETELWEKIKQNLENNDIHNAAFRLRIGTEQFFEGVCDALEASIQYKSDGRWELSHYLNAGVSAYKKLLKEAKNVANSWGNEKELEAIQERESIFDQIWKRTTVEQWAVNPNVHYSKWADFTVEDFRPVIDAFRDLFEVFICQRCGSMIKIASSGVIPVSFGCNCGFVTYTL
ncbi:MAG: chromosome segregation protein SMC, partial [Proteobacteria bacterium]|nr:chromosome segregation protein SMC [Pseudomonadota bacterium]